MTTEQTAAEWRIIGETVPGASHLRAGIPNQDAIVQLRESSRALPVILSIADGHGSPKCFRSDRGSRFAVKIIANLFGEFLDQRRGEFDLAEIESNKDSLADESVKRWRAAVAADLQKEPFKPEEFERLEQKSDAKARKLVEENPLLAYGTTSLTVAVETDFTIYFQLGDGDILTISDAGEVAKPLSADQRLLANETTSLCLPDAAKDFRFAVKKISGDDSPAMILLSTDGYLNSFSTEAGFFQAATDILGMLRGENGFQIVGENLKAWLEEATSLGSGDDCTVGIIYRPQAIQKPIIQNQTIEPAATTAQSVTAKAAVLPPEDQTASTAEIAPGGHSPGDQEDVTVTITIKKDKNKISASPAVTVSKSDQQSGGKTVDPTAQDAPDKNRQ